MARIFKHPPIKLISTCLRCYSVTAEAPIIDLPMGRVKGKLRSGIYGHQFFSFEGIPYGEAPAGKLRFKAPISAPPWECLLDCTSESELPLQEDRTTGKVVGSEDCLYLNVYTKTLTSQKPLPVMVYIYGGAFRTGGATYAKYAPDYLMREDIVFVLFNYRLGIFGFLSLNDVDLSVPGNAGLKDQILALKWIQRYISYFNGDPENITLFGTSAGAASVHFMLSTPQACGLFHKAILMSGCMLNPWVETAEAMYHACQLVVDNGCKGATTANSILQALNELRADRLIKHNLLSVKATIGGCLSAFVPTIEPYKTEDTVVDRSYLELMQTAWGNQIPVMIGGVSFEGLNMYAFFKQHANLLENYRKTLDDALPREIYSRNKQAANEFYAQQLIKQHKLDQTDNLLNVLDFYSYKLFWHGLHRSILARLANTPKQRNVPTYLYRFDFDSPTFNLQRIKMCGNDVKQGVAHADDTAYIFYKLNAWKLDSSSREYQTIQRMVGILTAFAKTGNPNCKEIGAVSWQPVTMEDPYCALNISDEVKFMSLPEKETLNVWHDIYEGSVLY